MVTLFTSYDIDSILISASLVIFCGEVLPEVESINRAFKEVGADTTIGAT